MASSIRTVLLEAVALKPAALCKICSCFMLTASWAFLMSTGSFNRLAPNFLLPHEANGDRQALCTDMSDLHIDSEAQPKQPSFGFCHMPTSEASLESIRDSKLSEPFQIADV